MPTIRRVGPYLLHDEIAKGGMAAVHLGALIGPKGFSAPVAIKQMHPTYARDPEHAAMLIDEARIAVRVRHANVVSMLDLVQQEGELFIIMEYVPGETLAALLRFVDEEATRTPVDITIAIVLGALRGLNAAHDAHDERGAPLGIVHRDVSPQNVLVGSDGVARVLDFGIAKAEGRLHATREGEIKGKLSYMAPEQVRGGALDRRVDVYAAAVVLWEALAGRRLFGGGDEAAVLEQVLLGCPFPPSRYAPELPEMLDEVVLRGLHHDPAKRFATAAEMARALEAAIAPAPPARVAEWVEARAHQSLRARAALLSEVEVAAAAIARDDAAAVEAAERSRAWTPPSTRLRARALPVVAAGVVLVAVASAGALFASRRSTPTATIAAASSSPMQGDAPGPALSGAASATVGVSVGAFEPASGSGAALRTPPVPESTIVGRTFASPSLRRARPARGSLAVEDCRAPVTIDSAGKKIYKRACL